MNIIASILSGLWGAVWHCTCSDGRACTVLRLPTGIWYGCGAWPMWNSWR